MLPGESIRVSKFAFLRILLAQHSALHRYARLTLAYTKFWRALHEWMDHWWYVDVPACNFWVLYTISRTLILVLSLTILYLVPEAFTFSARTIQYVPKKETKQKKKKIDNWKWKQNLKMSGIKGSSLGKFSFPYWNKRAIVINCNLVLGFNTILKSVRGLQMSNCL